MSYPHVQANATTAEQFPALGGGSAVSARPSWGPPRGPALPSGEPRNVNGHAGPREAPKNEVVQKEAFPSLGGGGIVNENVKWGAPASTMNGQPDSKEGVALSLLKTQLALSPKELRLIISKTRNDPRRVGKAQSCSSSTAGTEFNAESSESFPTLGGGGSRAPAVPTWGARNVTVSHSTQAAKAAAAKEAKVVAAAKEAAEAIAEAKAARSSKDEKDQKEKEQAQVVEVQVAKDVNNFPELPSSKSSTSKDVPKKASKAALQQWMSCLPPNYSQAAAKPAAAKPAPKALLKDKPSSSKTSGQEASKEALTEQAGPPHAFA
eukprot:g29268.t1